MSFLDREAKRHGKGSYFSRLLRGGLKKGKNRAEPYSKESPRRQVLARQTEQAEGFRVARTTSERTVARTTEEIQETVAGTTETERTQEVEDSGSLSSPLKRKRNDDDDDDGTLLFIRKNIID